MRFSKSCMSMIWMGQTNKKKKKKKKKKNMMTCRVAAQLKTEVFHTWRVSPKRIQRIGMAEPMLKARLIPKMIRNASSGVENLN